MKNRKTTLLNCGQFAIRWDASPRVTLLLLRRIQHDFWRPVELRGSWEFWETLLQNWFCLCPACHPQSLLGQWVDRRGLRGIPTFCNFFSSLPIFSLNITRLLVCFLVFPCVDNVFSGNLNTKMSTRISSPLETRNLISSFLDPRTANVTKASRCHTSREIADLRYGFWAHLWPCWRWSGFGRRVASSLPACPSLARVESIDTILCEPKIQSLDRVSIITHGRRGPGRGKDLSKVTQTDQDLQ